VLITREIPEIEIRNIFEIRRDAGKGYEEQAEKPKRSGEDINIHHEGLEGEICKSCLEMPEEQRKNAILEIQQVAEEILKAYGIIAELSDLLKGEWFLKLWKPGFEKKLVLSKYGEEIFIGFYTYPEDIPIPDPNLVLLSQNGFWYPQRIEEKFEETVVSFFTGAYGDYDFLNIVPENLEQFQAFQRDFARTIKEQGWDKSDVKVLEKIMPKD
jgi:hypothetical protein